MTLVSTHFVEAFVGYLTVGYFTKGQSDPSLELAMRLRAPPGRGLQGVI